ncbi:MAG TPA: 4-hydroxy-tetrahydrodipicolinate synthase, partial [Actinomycetota bacterium]|nr:4-hydroxy-tetrahydrodipicolinate synthase [Actinomycetota bacterium]
GCDGLVVSGSTGESPTLSDAEKDVLLRAVREAVGTDAALIAGTGTYSTQESVELTFQAAKAGADGVLVVTPYYNKPPQDALLSHFRAVADASEIPVMLYDVPARTATKIAPETVLRAAEHPRIVAVKEASSDLTSVARYASRLPEGFQLYSGNDNETLALQAWGAVGVVSVLGHLVAPRLREQFEAFDAGDIARVREIQASYIDLFTTVFETTNPIGIKAAMRMLGFRVGPPRPPLGPASPDLEERIRRQLEEIGAL